MSGLCRGRCDAFVQAELDDCPLGAVQLLLLELSTWSGKQNPGFCLSFQKPSLTLILKAVVGTHSSLLWQHFYPIFVYLFTYLFPKLEWELFASRNSVEFVFGALKSNASSQFNSTIICVGIYKLESALVTWMYEFVMQELSQAQWCNNKTNRFNNQLSKMMTLKKETFETLAILLQKGAHYCYCVKLSLSRSPSQSHALRHKPRIEVQSYVF